jgi:transcriptional regulator with XRE-family HTH domain
MNLGNKIEQIRLSHNLSKAEMSRKLGVSAQLLGQYEKGRQVPKVKFLQSLKNVFGVDLLQTNVYNESETNQSIFNEHYSKYVNKGYSPDSPILSEKQTGTLLLLIASEVSFLSEQWKKKEQMSVDEVRKSVREQLQKIEDVLSG